MIGQTVSHYTILEKLGEGGMGVVYKAHDLKLDRTVALKFLPSHLTASKEDTARFIQEAKAASALNHPNVCTIHDIQESDGQIFIVMEFVDGQTLQERKTSLTTKQAIDIGIQIADGLAAAHTKGIVHRDIKPENIMVRKDGICQIMDFGLAKLQGVTRLTQQGSTVGTAGYMSPEQIQGQDTDHRSDIFSFGVLLYELLTGQLPFKGVHETAMAYEIVNVDPLPMSLLNPDLDPALDSIVVECLEKDPNERTQSVKQISVDLQRFRRESNRQRQSRVVPTRPGLKTEKSNEPGGSTRPSKARMIWRAIAVGFGLLLVAAMWQLLHVKDTPRAVARLGIFLPRGQSFGAQDRPALAISPDGSRLVYAANGQLFQRRLDSFEAEAIPGTEDGMAPFFSPDGRWLGFFAGEKLKKVPLSGGAAVDITPNLQTHRGGTWLEDGTIVYSPNGRGGLYRVRDDGGEAAKLTTVDTTLSERTHRWPQPLPDGRSIIYTVGNLGSPDYYEDASIVAMDLRSGDRKMILKGASSAAYVPTGYLVYAHTGTLFAAPFDLDRLEVKGSSYPLVDNVSGDVTTGAAHYSIARNGTLVYIPGHGSMADWSLVFVDRNDKATVLPARPQAYVDARISPDGRRVAVAIQSGKDYDIWVYDIRRNTTTRLTFGGANRSPVWSPDGKRIAYSNNLAGLGNTGAKIVILNADGTGTPEAIAMPYDRTYVNCWSHDGTLLIVTVPTLEMGWDLWVVPASGARKPWPFLSTRFSEAFADLSPDGNWIAYESTETGPTQIFVRPFPKGEGKWQISSENSESARWSRDGKTLYYNSLSKGVMAVPIATTGSLSIGQPAVTFRSLPALRVESGVRYDISADGQSVLLVRPKDENESPQQINIILNWFDEIDQIVHSRK